MTDVISQPAPHAPAYRFREAEDARAAVETFMAYAAASVRAGGQTTLLPPMRIRVDALSRLVAAIETAEPVTVPADAAGQPE